MAAARSCLLAAAAACLLLAAGCERVTSEGFDPSSATYSPTAPRAVESVEHLSGPTVYTVDARSDNVWVYFDFSRAAVVPVLDPKTDGWDLAFKRYVVRTNGGRSNPAGQGAVLRLARRDFAAVSRVPDEPEFQPDVHPQEPPPSLQPGPGEVVQLQLSGERAGAEAGDIRHSNAGWQVRQAAGCSATIAPATWRAA